MPETKQISTLTELNVIGNAIAIKTSYNEDILPNTIVSFIKSLNGELVIRMKNYPSEIDYVINSDGELILLTNSGDASNYSVDSNGDLIYTQ